MTRPDWLPPARFHTQRHRTARYGIAAKQLKESAEVTPDTLGQADKTATETPAPIQQATLAAASGARCAGTSGMSASPSRWSSSAWSAALRATR